jgi:hypothetical protein
VHPEREQSGRPLPKSDAAAVERRHAASPLLPPTPVSKKMKIYRSTEPPYWQYNTCQACLPEKEHTTKMSKQAFTLAINAVNSDSKRYTGFLYVTDKICIDFSPEIILNYTTVSGSRQ